MKIQEIFDAFRKTDKILIVGDACDDYYQDIEPRVNPDGNFPAWREVSRAKHQHGMAMAVEQMVMSLGGWCAYHAVAAQSVTRYSHNGNLVMRIDKPYKQHEQELALRDAIGEIKECGAIIACDHGKGAITESGIRELVRTARLANVPILVDPYRGANWDQYRGATVIKGNLGECLGRDMTAAEWIVRTDGENGLSLMNHAVNIHYPTTPKSGSAVGCGDMVAAVLGMCLAAKIPLTAGCQLANIAAGLKVGERCPFMVTREKITKAASDADFI